MDEADAGDLLLKFEEVTEERGGAIRAQDRGDVAAEGFLVARVAIDPGSISLGLGDGLDHISTNAGDEGFGRGAVSGSKRPGADQSLVEKIFLPRIWAGFAGDGTGFG